MYQILYFVRMSRGFKSRVGAKNGAILRKTKIIPDVMDANRADFIKMFHAYKIARKYGIWPKIQFDF